MTTCQTDLPAHYYAMSDQAVADAITARRRQLGRDVLILGHHYQQEAVIRHADLTGDSLKLSRLAAGETRRRRCRHVVFCGVNFMAETADLLTDDDVKVMLPHRAAACPMAAMADEDEVRDAWSALREVLGPDAPLVPVAYVNSDAAVKAFTGEHGGACCTSGNAAAVLRWALDGGTQPGRSARVLFLPDQHLGRNTAAALGLVTERDAAAGAAETAVWDPRHRLGGLTESRIRAARLILWKGHCYVHTRFTPDAVERLRAEGGNGSRRRRVIVHPECVQPVVDLADDVGSTEHIIRRLETAEPGERWAVGTEVHLVERLARRHAGRGVDVRILGGRPCICVQMFRIDPQHLLWVLDHLARGSVVNRVAVEQRCRAPARAAVERMLALG